MHDDPPSQLRFAFPLAVGVLAVLSFCRYLSQTLSFTVISFGDAGWPLAVDAMLDAGFIPTVDFGYFYGLLSLAIDWAWFALVGRTPGTVAGLIGVGCFGIALGMVRFASAVRLGWWGRAVLLCAVPMAVMPLPYPTPVHAIEAALLVNALAFQARGRYGAALVLVTLAVFVKPGLGYVHGLILLLFVLGGFGSEPGWRGRIRTLVPAAACGLATSLGLIVWFGIGPLLQTLFPFSAAQNYGDEKYGFFFGDGRQFWLPDAVHLPFYLLTPAGFWLLATAWLTVAAVMRIRRLHDPAAATVVTCALLHLGFVLFLYGNRWSWLYYSAILVCGVSGVIQDDAAKPRRRLFYGMLASLALLGQAVPCVLVREHWKDNKPATATAGLFASPDDATAWAVVREVASREKVMVFSNTGGAFVVFPEVDSPRVWFLLRSTATPAEIERVRSQLRAAKWLVLPDIGQPLFPQWPEFASELQDFQEVAAAPSFRFCRRVGP